MPTLDDMRAQGCPCAWWQPGGQGPWALLAPSPACPLHGDRDDDDAAS